eukprot:m.451952 g.451952  ORF g.451952 m.451952 type:complete len:185 (+) comp20239_c0_seq1:333-887(+)
MADMALTDSWALHFSERSTARSRSQSFEEQVKEIGSFSDVKSFWEYFSHLAPAGELPVVSDYHLFKRGIKPMWEDPANQKGGKWIVRIRKGLASRFWEKLVIAIIGDQFDDGDEICGAVISIRYREDIVSVWNRSAHKGDVTQKIKRTLQNVLELPMDCVMEYKAHDASLRDKSSFRNTDVFRP